MKFVRKINEMPEIYVIFARKSFFPIFGHGGGANAPCTPSATPMLSCSELKRLKWHKLLAGVLGFLGQVVAHEEGAFKQLDANDGEDELKQQVDHNELKQQVDDHDDEYVLDRVDKTIEHSLSTLML